MNRTDFAAVEAFTRVAETGSFRAAALALSAPVSTVSMQVRRLEERLKARLFERSTRRVVLTEEGRRYFEQVRAALDAMMEAENGIEGIRAEARGRLRIAAPVEFGQAVLGRVLGCYGREHPNVEIEVELTGAHLDPMRDGFDVVLQVDPAVSTSLVARKMGTPTQYHLVASSAYLAERGTPAHPRDLSRHTCLVMGTRQAPTTWRFVRGATRLSTVHRQATANSWVLLRDLAVAGCGIARLPDYLVLPALAEGTLVSVLEHFRPPPEQLYAVYVRSPHIPVRLSAFIAALKAHLDVWPGCLARAAPNAPTGGAERPGLPRQRHVIHP